MAALYTCRESSANQPVFLQNKPNFLKPKTNATFFAAKGYEDRPPLRDSKKRTQSNPNEPNLPKAKMTLTLCTEKYYGKTSPLRPRQNKPSQTQFQTIKAKSKLISNAETAYSACRTRDCHGPGVLAMTIGRGDGERVWFTGWKPVPQRGITGPGICTTARRCGMSARWRRSCC
jgi:hypothetical protein